MKASTKKIKESKIRSVIPQKVGKVILWILLVLLLIRGVGSFFRNDTQQASNLINEFMKTKEYKSRIESEAAAFAESFAMEFLTFEGSGMDDYIRRLKPYVPSYLEMSLPFNSDVKEEAISSDALRVSWVSENQVNIDVKIKVKYTQVFKNQDNYTGEVEEEIKTILQDSFVRIPVMETGGCYVIDDYPVFIPAPEKATAEYIAYTGKSTDSETVEAIKAMLGNFFKTYYNGNTGEISYYLNNPSKPIKGLEGRYEFVKLDSVNIFAMEEERRYVAIVSLTVKDSVNGQILPQKYHAITVNKDGRHYIDMFDIRAGNLNNSNIK